MSLITVQTNNLKKNFGKFTALNGIDLTVKKGEVFGFIGPNGAGKTTTIRILLGILKATEGTAQLFGLDSWHDAVEIHKKIAYVPGDVSLWPNLTGGEVIDLLVSLNGTCVDLKRRQTLIEKFDLDTSKKCRTYSKGNRQKVTLISAFMSNAELFILDEPTSGLDPLMEQVFQSLVAEQKELGKSVLLSSHILSQVEKLCDNVGIIRQGRIVETGTLQQLRHLTRTNIYIETRIPIENLHSIKGIHNLNKRGQGVSFQADANHIDDIMLEVSKHKVIKIESTPPTLEDLFMRHYDNQQ